MKLRMVSIRYAALGGLLVACSALPAEPAVPAFSGDYSSSRGHQREREDGESAARIQGKILSTDTVTLENEEPGVRLRVDVDGQEMDVHLGPRWFLNQHAVNLTAGQPVTIVGFTIRLGAGPEGLGGEQPAVIANELRQGGQRVPLRTPAGLPLWQKEKP